MQARMPHVFKLASGAYRGLEALETAVAAALPAATLELVRIRAGQINGCAVCLDMHSERLHRAGESPERIWAVAGWRDAPWYDPAERAALRLTEAMTRLADTSDGIPDEVWAEASAHYDENALAHLVMAIASVNAWNRINAATRQVAGSFRGAAVPTAPRFPETATNVV
ncbi:MAG: carboxymuconolactone decarboxylase family protein [Streptomycetaceae bacterium]|nr:carboxymuconolactone decarboxylase family protein [Streptomycetaceae bacterium]